MFPSAAICKSYFVLSVTFSVSHAYTVPFLSLDTSHAPLGNVAGKVSSIDIIAIYIKQILEDLSKITGDNVSEDIINEIFSKFCLGK